MSRKRSSTRQTGKTPAGHTREKVVERLGRVTIYRRGRTLYLYYRENHRTVRRKVERNPYWPLRRRDI